MQTASATKLEKKPNKFLNYCKMPHRYQDIFNKNQHRHAYGLVIMSLIQVMYSQMSINAAGATQAVKPSPVNEMTP